MTSLKQLEAVHEAAEIAEQRLGHVYETLMLLSLELTDANEPVQAETAMWASTLSWLSSVVMAEENRLYSALQHDDVQAMKDKGR